MEHKYDVVIVGAGPAGCMAALTLRGKGLKIALIDKAKFPREKICGESLHLKGISALRSLGPEFAQEFADFPHKRHIKHSTISYKDKQLKFDWVNESYTVRRLHFDQFMLDLVRKYTKTDIIESCLIDSVDQKQDMNRVKIKGSTDMYICPVVIGADGANSVVAKTLAKKTLDRDHYFGAVRAYYSNVKGAHGDAHQVFFNTKFGFNYLWIFPIDDMIANVGFGMLSSTISKNKINLKDTFYKFIEETPALKDLFKDAEPLSDLEGFGVPLGSKIGVLSGERFLLCGDAGSLSNPVSGTGMGNAMVSGKLAGEQALQCLYKNKFDAKFMKAYDAQIDKHIIQYLMKTFKYQQFVSKLPFVMQLVFGLGQNNVVKRYIQRVV